MSALISGVLLAQIYLYYQYASYGSDAIKFGLFAARTVHPMTAVEEGDWFRRASTVEIH